MIWQTASGAQANINPNEVTFDRTNQALGYSIGRKMPVYSNDHVNLSGSSNCGTAIAMAIAAVLDVEDLPLPSLKQINKAM